ncbi:MAG: EamA family transporter [Acidobacteria bacterium]|nr:EamA family transporter [Acidobacteriota bacterium]
MQDTNQTSGSTRSAMNPVVLVVIAVLLWSTGGLFIKLTTLDAFSVNMGRSLFAAIVVAAFTFKKGLRLDRYTLFASFLYAATLTSFVYATKNTTAANAIFLQYTAPIYVLVLAPFLIRESFHIRDLVTVLLCIAGMTLFFLDNASSATAPDPFSGNIAGLVSGVCFGLYFIFLRHPRSEQRNPAVSVFYGNLIIVLVMIPLIAQSPPAAITTNDLLAIAFLGIFQIGIAYILFTKGVAAGVRPLDASIIGFIEPLINPIWVLLFVGETPTIWAVIGGAVIIAAVAVHTIRQYTRKAVSAEA